MMSMVDWPTVDAALCVLKGEPLVDRACVRDRKCYDASFIRLHCISLSSVIGIVDTFINIIII